MEQNFGYINAVFLQNSQDLFKTKVGKSIIKEYISIIKNSKNLLKEHSVYEFIETINYSENVKDQVVEAVALLNDINKKQLKEEHVKLINLLEKNNIQEIENVENKLLFENIDKLIFSKKSIKSISEKVTSVNAIVESIKTKQNIIFENKEVSECDDLSVNYIVQKFNEKYSNALNAEQRQIFESVSSFDEDVQTETFENERKACLKLTNDFLKEAIDNDTREGLLSVKEKLLEDKYNKDTYIEDIISYVDLKNTLGD